MNTFRSCNSHFFTLAVVLCSAAVLAGCSWIFKPEPSTRATSTVFRAGEEGYKIYRIPAVVKAANGDLLAFAEGRAGGDLSELDLVMKRSSDGGLSWSELSVVKGGAAFKSLVPAGTAVSVGNPTPVVDLMDPENPGRVWLAFTLENDRVFVSFSDDHGARWSVAEEITPQVKKEAWGWYATGPVHAIQLQRGPYRGRLVVPSNHRLGRGGNDSGATGAQVIFSDDHGASWQLGAVDDAYADGINPNETTVVELADGRLLFNTRDQHGRAIGTRGNTYSNDGGESFQPSSDTDFEVFQPSHPALDPPVVQASLLRAALVVEGDKADVILFSGPDSDGPWGKGRSDLLIRYSLNEGQTWQDGLRINVGPAAYSDLVRLEQYEYGVLFESGDKSPYERIDFARFTLDQL